MSPVTEIISLSEAQALVLDRVRPLAAEIVPLEQAAGRVLAEQAQAVVDLPPFRSSAMDGYAVCSADTPGTLPVVFRIAAGAPAPRPLAEGEAMAIATGAGLRAPGSPLGPGEVYESNGVMLAAQLAATGAEVTRLEAVADDEAEHRRALERGLEFDLLVTSGGVSVGPHDLVRRIEAEVGVEELFWGVAVKPGKPVSFGVRGSTLVFGLPGNPVSSLVTCEVFVLPALRA